MYPIYPKFSSQQMAFDLTCPPLEIVKLMANYLNHITSINDQRPLGSRKPTRFHARTLPSIDMLGYLNRILKYAPCSSECLLGILIYLERISVNKQLSHYSTESDIDEIQSRLESTQISTTESVILDSYNIHRLVITSALLSIKFLSDVFYTNLHVSRIVR